MEKRTVKPVSSGNKNSLNVEPEHVASFPLHSNWCPLYGTQWHANAGVNAAEQAVLLVIVQQCSHEWVPL